MAERTPRLADYIKRVTDDAPPLTADQRDRLALLLRPKPDAEPGLPTDISAHLGYGSALDQMMGLR
jgi:hypothetical protein